MGATTIKNACIYARRRGWQRTLHARAHTHACAARPMCHVRIVSCQDLTFEIFLPTGPAKRWGTVGRT